MFYIEISRLFFDVINGVFRVARPGKIVNMSKNAGNFEV